MLRKSPAVIRTHSWPSLAPMSCMALEPRNEQVYVGQFGVHLVNSWIGLVGRRLWWRPWLVDLPGQRHPVRWVLGQDIEQDGRPGPRLSEDDNRGPDIRVSDRRVALHPIDDAQPAGEVLDDVGPSDDTADFGQGTPLVQVRDQSLGPLLPRLIAEVGESCGLLCLIGQLAQCKRSGRHRCSLTR